MEDDEVDEKCTKCGKDGFKRKDFRYHMKHCGAEKNTFSCNNCNKGCSREYSLKRHQNMHTGQQSFKCTQCTKSFTLLDNLRRHVKKLHNEQ